MNIGTRLFTWLKGTRVGADAVGNIYYEERRARPGYRTRRWVAYAGRARGLSRCRRNGTPGCTTRPMRR